MRARIGKYASCHGIHKDPRYQLFFCYLLSLIIEVEKLNYAFAVLFLEVTAETSSEAFCVACIRK